MTAGELLVLDDIIRIVVSVYKTYYFILTSGAVVVVIVWELDL